MKKLLLLAAILAVVFTPAVAQADNVLAGDIIQVQPGASRYSTGGAFLLSDLTAPTSPVFETFCLETNEYLNFGIDLKVLSVTDRAIAGGVGGGSPDYLDTRTAFIYQNYRYGNPYGWSGSDVQQAVWFIEQEINSAPAWVTDGTLAGYITQTQWTGLGNVRVLNIGYGSDTTGQDLLTVVPDGGATLMLLGGAPDGPRRPAPEVPRLTRDLTSRDSRRAGAIRPFLMYRMLRASL